MAKEKPFHTATHSVGAAARQKFFEPSADVSGEEYGAPSDQASGGLGELFNEASTPPSSHVSSKAQSPQTGPSSLAPSEWTADFVSRITHDLMNALSAATSFAELLIEDLPADDPRRQHADKAHQGVGLAMRLVKMLRDPARWRDQNINYLDAARADLRADPGVRKNVGKYAENRADTRVNAPQPVAEAAAQGQDEEMFALAPVAPHEALRILVVDGRSAAADALCQGFDALGHKAFAVYDPQEAFTLFCETSGDWDVVMCPVILRGQGGAGLLQKMKTVDPRVLTMLGTGAPAPQSFSPVGCDLVVESAAGAQKISTILGQHIARTGHRPRVRVVA